MTLYDLPNLTTGFDEAIVGTVTAVPIFTPMFLFFVFGVVFLGGLVSQKNRTGSSDATLWATIASMATLMISLVLTLTVGLIQLEILAVVVVVTIMSAAWLFFDKKGEF